MYTLGWEVGGRLSLQIHGDTGYSVCGVYQLLTSQDPAQFSDSWCWQPDPDTGYSVCGVYRLLTSQDPVTLDAAENLIWHTQVPLKVSICAWRLLRDRLPMKENLVT
ncbi:cysteine-rich receptor-like protein kinase [Trifolium pratense]|uniref:Cysteine-rich receptor-like protein kinase n=1 Tax=Trifolium pratense TaxID=57577 RepID=A0A2K3LXB7_TRIPR|nr:cysteine-rich receptor-like protein kinase [Trifolium pratense]